MFEARAGVKLRDARINLLVEVLDCVTALQTEIDREELEILHALLERRIFNFLQRGNNEAYTPNAIEFIDLQHCDYELGRLRKEFYNPTTETEVAELQRQKAAPQGHRVHERLTDCFEKSSGPVIATCKGRLFLVQH